MPLQRKLTIRIGELAQSAGVKIATLRYYERRGLLPPASRRASGYREYQPDAVAHVRFIRRAQRLGFTLADIAELLLLRGGSGGGRASARALAVAKIADIDARVTQLGAMRAALDALATACACGEPTHCAIIEVLNDEAAVARPENHD
ncbi:MAG: helix-turn-helix domain-containing protein [Gemmatimonadaceae bacterium]